MARLKRRMIFDLLLTAVLIFEMLHQFTGDELHEYVGFAFFACIVLHLLFAKNWIASSARALSAEQVSRRRKWLIVVACLLLIDVLVLAFSSICISRTLWNLGADLTALNPGKILYPVHTASAYLLCVFVLVHLAMHWMSVASVLKVEYDPSRRKAIGQGVNAAVAVGGVALGIIGAVQTGQSVSGKTVTKDDWMKAHNELEATGGSSTQNISGYREINAETGEFSDGSGFEVESLAGQGGATHELQESEEAATGNEGLEDQVCPLCPRQCSLSAPSCERPYEAGLI